MVDKELTLEPVQNFVIASDHGISIDSRDDVSVAVGAALGRGLILSESDLGPAFFDLRTGLAGELIQKLVNYRVRTAIIVATPKDHDDRFAELAHEHATHPTVRFVRSIDDAIEWLQT
jgi:Domain of unknown function (DUF4180)